MVGRRGHRTPREPRGGLPVRWATAVAALAMAATAIASADATSAEPAAPPAATPVDAMSSALTLPASKFVPLVPTRALDTRATELPDRGLARLFRNSALSVDPITGTAVQTQLDDLGIAPSTVTAVAINVTLVDSAGPGFAVAWPTGFARPDNSTNNALFAGHTTPNLVISPLGIDGKISIWTLNDADYIVDVMGVMVESGASADGRFISVGPVRHSDTRFPDQHVPGQTRYEALETRVVDLTGAGVPATASAVVLNVTADRTSAPSFVRVSPAGQVPAPDHSNVNVPVPNQATSNQVISGVTDGRIEVFTLAATDLIIDVTAYFTGESDGVSTDGLYVPTTPGRLLDTRDVAGPNAFTNGAKVPGGQSLRLPIVDRLDIPATGVKAAAFNVTAVLPDAPGFVAAFPSAGSLPATSSVNYNGPGVVVPNHAITSLSTSGSIDLFTLATSHLLVDVTGYFLDESGVVPTGERPTKTIRESTFVPTRLDGTNRPGSAPYDWLFERGLLFGFGDRTSTAPGIPVRPVRVAWDACQPIRYALNVDLATDEQIEVLIASIEEVEEWTGIDFQFAGVTSGGLNVADEVVNPEAASPPLPFQYLPPDDDGSGPVDVVIGYSDPSRTIELSGGVVGVGGSLRTAFDGTGRADAARGFALIDLDELAVGSPAAQLASLQSTTTHELGHMVGLGHVDEGLSVVDRQGLEAPGTWPDQVIEEQLMYPFLSNNPRTDFAAGDQLGLWELYNDVEQPCGGTLISPNAEPELVDVVKVLDELHGH
ncbi:MAG: hypothetical protein AAFP84_17070 [Actinomycetota bacterium]